MADQMDGKGRPPKRRSGLTRGQKGLIAAAAVLAVALAGVLAWQSLFVRPDLNTGKTVLFFNWMPSFFRLFLVLLPVSNQ